jgi:Cu-Zn family superoxide dismutase
MKLDTAARLWVAGGRTGRAAVVDARSGKVLKRFETTTPAASLINDVALVGTAAFFTDTFTPTLWRVTTRGDQIGELEPWLAFAGTPLQYAEGPNLNGILATPDGRHLVVIQMNKGLLFRIDIADKRVSAIDVGGAPLSGGDGLVLDGTTLYVVRQTEEEIVTLELSADLGTGRVRNRFKNPALAWPATAAKAGNRLLVVNSQFNRRANGSAKTPFEIVGIPLAMLAGSRP